MIYNLNDAYSQPFALTIRSYRSTTRGLCAEFMIQSNSTGKAMWVVIGEQNLMAVAWWLIKLRFRRWWSAR